MSSSGKGYFDRKFPQPPKSSFFVRSTSPAQWVRGLTTDINDDCSIVDRLCALENDMYGLQRRLPDRSVLAEEENIRSRRTWREDVSTILALYGHDQEGYLVATGPSTRTAETDFADIAAPWLSEAPSRTARYLAQVGRLERDMSQRVGQATPTSALFGSFAVDSLEFRRRALAPEVLDRGERTKTDMQCLIDKEASLKLARTRLVDGARRMFNDIEPTELVRLHKLRKKRPTFDTGSKTHVSTQPIYSKAVHIYTRDLMNAGHSPES